MNEKLKIPQQGGSARCDAISYQELLDAENVEVPASLREDTCPEMGYENIAVDRYTSKDFFDQEVEKLWPKVWQMVCREEDLAQVGDHIVYDIAHYSFIIVRSSTETIKGFYNSCLHRGRQLKDCDGHSTNLRCPFHAFTWKLSGELESVPCEWDFPGFADDNSRLPEVKVDTWGGFVFINMDDDCIPLQEYLGVLPEHFARWSLQDCYKGVHVQKVVKANWKVVSEAFLESFHTIETHPQIMPYTADANSQYDCWGDNINRTITPMGIPSPHLENVTDNETMAALVGTSGRMDESSETLVPSDTTARKFMANNNKLSFGEMAGEDYAWVTDSEVLDAILYNVFPNFAPWAGFNPNIIYRFRPNGNDVDSAIMDVMMLYRYPKGSARPDPAPVHRLDENEPWTNAEELGGLGAIFEQDMANLSMVQKGMKTSKKGAATLGNYQESRIRHVHKTLDKYLNQ